MASRTRLLAGITALALTLGCADSTGPDDFSGQFRLTGIEGMAIPYAISETEVAEGEVLSLFPDGRAAWGLEILHVAGEREGEREIRAEMGGWTVEDGLITLTTPNRNLRLRPLLGGAWLRTTSGCGNVPCLAVLHPVRTYHRESTAGDRWIAGL